MCLVPLQHLFWNTSRNCQDRTGSLGSFSSFSPVSILLSSLARFSSQVPWRMVTPSVLQTLSWLHYKNTTGLMPDLMSILDHLEEERIFLAVGNWTSIQIRLWAVIFSVLDPNHSNSWNPSMVTLYLMPKCPDEKWNIKPVLWVSLS